MNSKNTFSWIIPKFNNFVAPVTTCTKIRSENSNQPSGFYYINPLRLPNGRVSVYCDMASKNGTGVTVIGHDSENRTKVWYCYIDRNIQDTE